MDWQHIANIGAYAWLALFALSAVVVGAYLRNPIARKLGGLWHIELFFFLAGPVCVTTAGLAGADDAVASGSLPELVNRLARYIIVAIAVVAIVRMVRHRRPPGLPMMGFLVFYAALWLSAFFGYIPDIQERYWVTPLAVMAVVADGRYSPEQLVISMRRALRILLALTGFSALVVPAIAFRLDGTRHLFGIPQLQGLTGHPNTLTFVAVAGLLLEAHTRSRLAWRSGFLAALILAQSSTGYAMAVAGILLISNPGTRLLRTIAAASVAVALIVYFFSPETIISMVSDSMPAQADTLTGRTTIWDGALNGFEANHVFGYGPTLLDDQFRWMYLPGFDAAAQAHNQFIQTIAGEGLVGVTSLVILALVLFVRGFKRRRFTAGLSLALVVILALRCVTETPLRPAGVSYDALYLSFLLAYLSGKYVPPRPHARSAMYPQDGLHEFDNDRSSAHQAP